MKHHITKLRKLMKDAKIDAFMSSEPLIRRYLSGFTGSTGYAIVTHNDLEFCTDFRYFEQVLLECPDFKLIKLDKDYTAVEYLKDKSFERIAVEETFISLFTSDQICNAIPKIELVYGLDLINSIRMIKSPDEEKLHRASCEITNKIIENFFAYVKPGMSEKELNSFIQQAIGDYDDVDFFFDPITLTGPNTSLSHGKPTIRKVELGDFILLDMGVNYKGYASDVTRTAVVGKATDKQKRIYSIVLDAHKTAAAEIRPGMTAYEADALARDVIVKAGYGDYFGHALGHGFHDGLVLRDDPLISSTVLKENMIFTIEPGIYIPNWGGVRIEDVYILKADGCHSFCSYTKELQELDY